MYLIIKIKKVVYYKFLWMKLAVFLMKFGAPITKLPSLFEIPTHLSWRIFETQYGHVIDTFFFSFSFFMFFFVTFSLYSFTVS